MDSSGKNRWQIDSDTSLSNKCIGRPAANWQFIDTFARGKDTLNNKTRSTPVSKIWYYYYGIEANKGGSAH